MEKGDIVNTIRKSTLTVVIGITVLIGWRAYSPARAQDQRDAATTWEYTVTGSARVNDLNKLGSDGWELCGGYFSTFKGTGKSELIFKRRKR